MQVRSVFRYYQSFPRLLKIDLYNKTKRTTKRQLRQYNYCASFSRRRYRRQLLCCFCCDVICVSKHPFLPAVRIHDKEFITIVGIQSFNTIIGRPSIAFKPNGQCQIYLMTDFVRVITVFNPLTRLFETSHATRQMAVMYQPVRTCTVAYGTGINRYTALFTLKSSYSVKWRQVQYNTVMRIILIDSYLCRIVLPASTSQTSASQSTRTGYPTSTSQTSTSQLTGTS